MDLTIVTFLPVVAAAIIMLLPQQQEQNAKYVALLFAVGGLLYSLFLFADFDVNGTGYQLVENRKWVEIGQFDLRYHLGVDGLSMPLVLLTTFLTVAAVLGSFSVNMRPRLYYSMLMLLSTSVIGVVVALDFMLFFLFWELELFPMFLLIAIWGSGRREYSATKFVLYTIAGSAFMLLGILALAFSANTFDIVELSQAEFKDTIFPLSWVFLFLFIGFAVKLPIVPLHTWLPDAHGDAPTAVSVMLAGVLLKMGGYGLIRMCVSILPETADDYSVWFVGIGAFSVLYGAFVTLRQTDLKRLIAYSSVSHMGLVLLGIGAMGKESMMGATYQMLAHGVVTGMLFTSVGLMYERTHTREIARLGGLARQMPLITTGLVFAGFASLGLPALAGFVAEVTVFLGSFARYEWAVLLSLGGVVLSAGYILWTLQRTVFGPVRHDWDGVTDAHHWWEHAVVLGLAASVILLGVYPALMMDMIGPAMDPIVQRLSA